MKLSHYSSASALMLATLLLTTACSGGSGTLSSGDGNVRLVLSSEPDPARISASGRTLALSGSSWDQELPAGLIDDEDGDDDEGGDDGTLARLVQANATLTGLSARNLDGQTIALSIALPLTVDLLGLAQHGSVELPVGSLPPGLYDQITVVIGQLELVFRDGAVAVITPPGDGWTATAPVETFQVIEGEMVTIKLTFKPANAFREHEGQIEFFPAFDCERI